MNDDVVRSHARGIPADRVLAATGTTPDDWYAQLDAADGHTIGHTAIAAWLVDAGVDPWWAQSVAIGYEQSRGLRVPGQRSDGTFAVSASRQVPGDREAVLDRAVAAATVTLGHPPTSERRGGRRPSARWTTADRESVLLTAEDGPRPDTVRLSATRERLTGPERVPEAKAALRELLADV